MRGLIDLGPLGGRPGGPGGKWGGPGPPPSPLLLLFGTPGDSMEDPAELGYILGGTEVDLPVGGPIAAGRPRGLDNLLDEGSLHSVAVSTSEGDCPLEKMGQIEFAFHFPALTHWGKLNFFYQNLILFKTT